MDEIKKVETFSAMDFLKDLDISTDDKKKLLLSIAAIMVNVGEDSTKMATAACMGLSIEDEKFAAFYNNEIKPIVKLDIQTIYDQLANKVFDEEDKKEKISKQQKFIIEMSKMLGCDSDGDIITRGANSYYINAQKGIFRENK